jgi:hypothetical protein
MIPEITSVTSEPSLADSRFRCISNSSGIEFDGASFSMLAKTSPKQIKERIDIPWKTPGDAYPADESTISKVRPLTSDRQEQRSVTVT